MSTKESIPTGIKRTVALMVETILIVSTFTLTAFAAPAKTEVPERVYEFGKRFNITMIIIAKKICRGFLRYYPSNKPSAPPK